MDTTRQDPFVLDGLTDDVVIDTDRWGIPHIRAANVHDVFFAQGFVAARDRLFQLDWWRRRGLGLVSEVLGERYVERDRAARLFLYRGDLRTEWLAYGTRTRQIVTAFVAGINAWVERTRQTPTMLPPEFVELGYAPALWDPTDVVRLRSHGLYANLEQEVARAITLRDFGPDAEDLRKRREPAIDLEVPEGLDLELISPEILNTYRLAMGPVLPIDEPPSAVAPDGSNNWAVMPHRTTTGRPILASDPHRAMTVPSLRYLVHLTCPEFDVIGAGEPALPGVSIGHNGKVAFGLTIFPVDQEDLYVYEIHPEDASLYRYNGTWERIRESHEFVPTPDGAKVPVELQFTRHGPVIHVDAEKGVAFAVRAAWLEPGTAPYLASLEYLGAASTAQFSDALDRWGAPGVNQVCADVDGHIFWGPRALIPVRPNWDGTLPVPGDGRYEWAGYRTAEEFPSSHDPANGWVASANEMNLPTDGSWEAIPISYEWFAATRARRIAEVLDESRTSVEASAELQNDYVNIVAREVIAHLPSTAEDPDAQWAISALCGWDLQMSANSGPALVFEQWFRHELRQALYADAVSTILPEDEVNAGIHAVWPNEAVVGDPTVDLELLRRAAQDDRRMLARTLTSTLAAAVRRVEAAHGPDRSAWQWGAAHTSQLVHPATPFMAIPPSWSTIGPKPKSGSSETVGVAAYDAESGIETVGASFRMVVDVGAWDNSLVVNSPGQSGDPRSPHYDDLYEMWLSDEYFQLCYSRDAIARHTESTLTLSPKS